MAVILEIKADFEAFGEDPAALAHGVETALHSARWHSARHVPLFDPSGAQAGTIAFADNPAPEPEKRTGEA
jgi:hypothetical protein